MVYLATRVHFLICFPCLYLVVGFPKYFTKSFWGCSRLFWGVPGVTLGVFGGHLGGVLGSFWKQIGGQPKTKDGKK